MIRSQTVLILALVFAAPALAQLRIGGSGGPTVSLEPLARAFQGRSPEPAPQLLPNLGSRGGIRGAAQGAIEVGVASRELSAEEAAQGVVQLEFARTPFVLAVSRRNAAIGLGQKDLVEILAGRRPAWPDGTPLRLVLRPEFDSDTLLLRELSAEVRRASLEAHRRPGMLQAATDLDSTENIENIAGALGTTTLAQILTEKRALRPLALDGVEPTVENARSGRYPLHKRYFLVLRQPPAEAARRFAEFVRSPAGRALLVQAGHWVPDGQPDAGTPRR